MKIAYLQSIYSGVYRFLDQAIINAFIDQGIQLSVFSPPYTNNTIKKILDLDVDYAFILFGKGRKDELLLLEKLSNVTMVGWFCEDPYFIENTSKHIHYFTIIFTVEKNAVKRYEALGHQNVYYLPLGYDPSVYYPQTTNVKDYESTICLIGHPYPNRITLVESILKKTAWDVTVIGGKWSSPLRKWINKQRLTCINYWVEPNKLPLYYSNAKIVLNPQRPIETNIIKNQRNMKAVSPNNKCFEIAACKAFQICDFREGISNLFLPSLPPTFKDNDQAIELIHEYILNSSKRKLETDAIHNEVKKNHTFSNRIQYLFSILCLK